MPFPKQKIEETLKRLGIKFEKVNNPDIGPSVTRFSFKPAEGVKIQDIMDLKNDVALALAAHPIRIEAPIPGTDLVGIEVPNQTKIIVWLKEELEEKGFKKAKGELKISFGRDVEYNQWIADLLALPHLMVGGATNSGKSVFFHSLIISLMAQHTPETLRFIVADPKRVEFAAYNGLPYLLTPVIMEYQKAANAAKWCLNELDRRFEILSKNKTKDIVEYNKKNKEKMPFIVFIIDEMVDFSVADEDNRLRENMVKLLRMGKAVGIHLIVGTSRPCEETYPDLLRANFPARLSFATASADDSEIILNRGDAVSLFGRGDCLFINEEMSMPVRLQAPFVDEEDIKNVVEYIKDEAGNKKFIDIQASLPPEYDDEELLTEAKDIVIKSGRASASLLQRKLWIGYARAASLLDSLEELGIVGPQKGSNPREVLVKKE